MAVRVRQPLHIDIGRKQSRPERRWRRRGDPRARGRRKQSSSSTGSSEAMEAEHRVEMPAPPAGKAKAKAAAPERRLIRFVRLVTLLERAGNALGTLAFTWATVVLLGGYAAELEPVAVTYRIGDYWAATIVCFVEAIRMFSSRSNKLVYHLFFSTKDALKPPAWNGLVVIVLFSDVFMCLLNSTQLRQTIYCLIIPVAILATYQFLCPRLHARNLLRRVVSLWSPMVATSFLGPSVLYSPFTIGSSVSKWIAYLVLCVIVLLLTISRLCFPGIVKLADSATGRKLTFWHKTIINLYMFAAEIMLVFTSGHLRVLMIIFQAHALVIVSFGNLQVPAAILRVWIAADRLWGLIYIGLPGSSGNLVTSLGILYSMVFGQGILYIVACILHVFSFILRRSLLRGVGFSGERGVEYVDLYYSYAFEKHMEGHILSAKNISIITFAMESLKSGRPKMKLQGLRMLDSFLKKEPFRTTTISKLTSSTETVATLLNMLEWTSEEGYRDIRLFAAKVLAELAVSLRVAPIPGAMQRIASLLHTVHGLKVNDSILYIDSQEPKQVPIQPADTDREEHPNSPAVKFWKQMAIYCLIPAEEPSKLIDEQNSYWILKFWKYITRWYSVPEEKQPMDHDFLPVLDMLILERLSCFHIENCTEISRAGLISTIIQFTSNITVLPNINESHHKLLKDSSFKVLRRLASIDRRFGVKVRHDISEHPFLLRNLAGILDDHDSCSQQLKELAAKILRDLAMDGNTREEIGHFQAIISRLVHAFLSRDTVPSVTDSDKSLQIIAGQALAVLTVESPSNCLAVSAEAGYAFIKELTTMIHIDRYKYIAASLLQNMCVHSQSMLSKADLKELSHILPEVLEGIMDAEGVKLEVLAGLGSHICKIVPEDFAQELERGKTKEIFIKGLISSLNANMKPAARCPGVTRAIVELAVCMTECNPSYKICFSQYRMMEALLVVEQRLSRAENYRYFSDDVGLMEHSVPLSALVARASEMMGGKNLYWGA